MSFAKALIQSPTFRQRRILSLGITAPLACIFGLVAWLIHARLGRADTFTGATLMACLLVLILIGVRRRIPALPLGRVSTWTQIHLYTGLFASAIYYLHVPHLVADGLLEGTLSILFLLVSASGLYGIYASRSIPKQLTSIRGECRFDQIAWHRDQVSIQAESLLESVSNGTSSRVLETFSHRYLAPYFEGRPRLTYLAFPTGIRRRRLINGLVELTRYLEEEGQATAGRLSALVRKRDDLDYQFALQLRLRVWVVIHGFLSINLVVLAVIHSVLALAFVG